MSQETLRAYLLDNALLAERRVHVELEAECG